jgi:hypothetical protein
MVSYKLAKPVSKSLVTKLSAEKFLKEKANHSHIPNQTDMTELRHKLWSRKALYSKSVILRGVGYSFLIIKNDFCEPFPTKNVEIKFLSPASLIVDNIEDDCVFWNQSQLNDFTYNKYLIVRTGHTKNLYQPIPNGIFIKSKKKNKKLVIYGWNKSKVNNFVAKLVKYRKPSVYTGRGIRYKHIKVLRKAGKKDKQKGRAF